MRDPEATRTAILDAAEAELLEKGFAEASTAGIARRARVTKSLIHHHFGSKEALWGRVKERRFSEYFQRQLAVLEGQAASAGLLRESVELYFRFLQSNRPLVRLLAWMALEGDHVTPEMAGRLNELGIEKLSRAQADGHLRADVDPGVILAMFHALTEHWFLHRCGLMSCLGLDPEDTTIDERYLDDMLAVFFRGLEPAPPSGEPTSTSG